jgi:hypothetical protein
VGGGVVHCHRIPGADVGYAMISVCVARKSAACRLDEADAPN